MDSKEEWFGYVTSKKTSYKSMGDKEDSEASRDFVKPALSKNMGQRARLLGKGHTLSGNNTPVRVYCGTRGRGLAAGEHRIENRKEKSDGL